MAQYNSTIPGEPADFGMLFDYTQWSPGTTVTLASVPWDSTYKDIVQFKDRDALVNYVQNASGPRVTLDRLAIVAPDRPVRVPIPFGDAHSYNYLMVSNRAARPGSDGDHIYFYFINDVSYVAPGTTQLNVQLDVWQTYGRRASFGHCYVERGHVAMADKNAASRNGADYLTVPEGLDIGDSYVVSKSLKKHIMGGEGTAVLVSSSTNLLSDPGTVKSPVLRSANPSRFEGLPHGSAYYVFPTLRDYRYAMELLAPFPWVTQGIQSVTAVPATVFERMKIQWYDFRPYEGKTSSLGVHDGFGFERPKPYTRIIGDLDGAFIPEVNGVVESGLFELMRNFRRDIKLPKYYDYMEKFKTFPYSFVEVTTFTGTPLVVQPEQVHTDHIAVAMYTHLSQPSPRIMFRVISNGALEWNDKSKSTDDYYFEALTGVTNLPTFSTLNDTYTAYMAANANSIAYQHSNASWSQQRAMMGADLSYGQATMGMNATSASAALSVGTANAMTDLQNQVAWQSLGSRTIQSGVGNVMGGMAAGPKGVAAGVAGTAVGALGGAMDTTIQNNARSQSTAITNNATNAGAGIANRTAGYMRDTNRAYSESVAIGDYRNAIAGINAQVQDAKLMQPSMVGQVGGDAFMLATEGLAVHARIKQIKPSAARVIGDYWCRYGYSIHRYGWIPKKLNVMTHFTYWKLSEVYLTVTHIPDVFRQTIRAIFEKGVTVWDDPAKIGTTNIRANRPVMGEYFDGFKA